MPERKETRPNLEDRMSLSWDTSSYALESILELLKSGGMVNFTLTQNFEIVLSLDTHAKIRAKQGLQEDQILLEGYVKQKPHGIVVEWSHWPSSDKVPIASALSTKLDTEISKLSGKSGK